MSIVVPDDPLEPEPAHTMVGKPGQDDAERLVRLRMALRLRKLGATYDQIAEEMGYASGSGVRQFILRALHESAAEHATELRALENARMDDELRTLNEIRIDTKTKPEVRVRAVEALTRNHARRARLNGLDAPVQVAVGAGSWAELDDALALLESVVKGEVTESHELSDDDGRDGDAGPGTGAVAPGSDDGDH